MNLAKFEFVTTIEATKSQALVLGWYQSEPNEKDQTTQHLYKGKRSKEIEILTEQIKASKHFSGKKNEVSFLRFFSYAGYSNLFLLGLGHPKKFSMEVVRQAGAALFQAQKKEKVSKVALQADSVFAGAKPSEVTNAIQAFCEGYLMAGYEYKDLKKVEINSFSAEGITFLGMKSPALVKSAEKAAILAGAVNFARSLGDRPANILTPTEFSRLIEKMAKERGIKCSILGRKEMEKEKMGLLIGVAQGSIQEPKLIILEHMKGKKADKPIALVGKGLTFDSGGISLKPADRMEEMKYDMMGAATVAGVFQALADLKVPRNVVGVIVATENMPGGRAQKPGDVQKSMTGKTVEIINTDAEGRLVLADAMEYVQKYFTPQAIADFATLTGAVVVALGTVTTGIMGTHRGLIDDVKKCANETGERVWELPLYEEYEEDLKSSTADIRNSGNREAGSSKAGMFLKFFVDSKVPWVHFDIAGSAWHRKDLNYHPSRGGSGVMVRLVTHWMETWRDPK